MQGWLLPPRRSSKEKPSSPRQPFLSRLRSVLTQKLCNHRHSGDDAASRISIRNACALRIGQACDVTIKNDVDAGVLLDHSKHEAVTDSSDDELQMLPLPLNHLDHSLATSRRGSRKEPPHLTSEEIDRLHRNLIDRRRCCSIS